LILFVLACAAGLLVLVTTSEQPPESRPGSALSDGDISFGSQSTRPEVDLLDPQDSRPNVVVIIADDMGWKDVGYHGSDIHTPRIDTLAKEGVVLDRFYAMPACSPTRAALMTGQSAVKLGVMSALSKINPTGVPLEARFLPEYLRSMITVQDILPTLLAVSGVEFPLEIRRC
jgi:hypothetical protein